MVRNLKSKSLMSAGVALAAGVAALGLAGQAAAASQIKISTTAMDTAYTATITNHATHVSETAYANGVTFTVQDWDPTIQNARHQVVGGTVGQVYTLYGFCVDIYHNISLGSQNLIYDDNFTPATGPAVDPLPNNFAPGTTPATRNISQTQLDKLTDLIDTGYQLHASETGQSTAYINNVEMQLAAIQAAIWQVENPTYTITVNSGTKTAGANVGGAITGNPAPLSPSDHNLTWSYQDYFNYYVAGTYTPLDDPNDSFYTIVEHSPYDAHQAFAIGWPVAGVPEPASWALMIGGFGAMGAALRRKRRVTALA